MIRLIRVHLWPIPLSHPKTEWPENSISRVAVLLRFYINLTVRVAYSAVNVYHSFDSLFGPTHSISASSRGCNFIARLITNTHPMG
jgi:hypothetical protein